MFRYSRNNRKGQDALRHHSFFLTALVFFYFQEELHLIGQDALGHHSFF